MNSVQPRKGGRPFTDQVHQLWLDSPRGRRLLEIQEREVRRVLPEVFGRHVLQIGSWGRDGQLIGSSETLHAAVIGGAGDPTAQVLALPEKLPILAKSIDAVVLPHTLEFARSPQSVLREVNRVITDRGRIFVLGFNPWGAWGLRKFIGFGYWAFPSGARFHSAGKICDWLELLDFEMMEVRRYGAGFPWTRSRSDGEPFDLAGLAQPFAEAYLLTARKRVMPMNLLSRLPRAQVKPLIGGIATEARTNVNTLDNPQA
jgi:SAM-dependent methyltransferase